MDCGFTFIRNKGIIGDDLRVNLFGKYWKKYSVKFWAYILGSNLTFMHLCGGIAYEHIATHHVCTCLCLNLTWHQVKKLCIMSK